VVVRIGNSFVFLFLQYFIAHIEFIMPFPCAGHWSYPQLGAVISNTAMNSSLATTISPVLSHSHALSSDLVENEKEFAKYAKF
jgi:hypothetical protein